MSRFLSKQKLLVGVLVISSLGIGYAVGAQPRMDAALALLQNARGIGSCPPQQRRPPRARDRTRRPGHRAGARGHCVCGHALTAALWTTRILMPALVAGIYVVKSPLNERRGWP